MQHKPNFANSTKKAPLIRPDQQGTAIAISAKSNIRSVLPVSGKPRLKDEAVILRWLRAAKLEFLQSIFLFKMSRHAPP
ncbi:hypothetical protein CHISP_2542 [Chitinispirillum alkaliphilum]|nr:hypothetical protein CHISP_2542 [Chitinispirillum alkaliphilum]